MEAMKIEWSQAEIDALFAKVAACELPPAPAGAGWSIGCDRDFLEKFRDHWLNAYDWKGALAELNQYPQFLVDVDGLKIHALHIRGEGERNRPLLLTHGWPGSHIEFFDVIERLTQPSKFGGKASDAFDLVIPTLPGYGYSGKPEQPMGPAATAAVWDKLMREHFGYSQYLAQGGDWGCLVTAMIGLRHGAHDNSGGAKAIHLNMMGVRPEGPPQNDAEADWLSACARAGQTLSGYSAVQMFKPLSLGWLSAGNPLGQAAWILERFHDWCDLSQGDIESIFGMDHLVTNVMLYVMNDSFASSVWFYHGLIRERVSDPLGDFKVETPTGFAAFPGDTLVPAPPRSRVELGYNLTHWFEPESGGHFAAMEKPVVFADDVRDWGVSAWPDF